MAIKKYFVARPKDGFSYDRKQNKYFSWGYDIWLNGARRQGRGFATRGAAEKAAQTLKEKRQNEILGILPGSDVPYLIELFQKKLDDMSGPDRTRAKRVFKEFLQLVPKKLKVPHLKKSHIKLYVLKRQSENVSASTIRREMVPIVAALNSADEYFEALEDYRPPKIPRPKVPKLRKNITINFEDRSKLLRYLLAPRKETETQAKIAEARRRTGVFLQFCLLTVSRPGEVASLKRSDVDWHAGIVTITGTKTRFVTENPIRRLRITETMAEILKERFEKSKGDFLFTRGGKVTPRMYKVLKEACEKCNIKYGGRILDGISFNTTRHTSTTELARSNKVDTKTIGGFTGHSDETMTLYYTHTNDKQMEIASQELEEMMGKNLYGGEFLESKSENN
jgi:integrase